MVINIPNGNGGGGIAGSCGNGTCGNGLEKVYPTAAVRYGYMKFIGEFEYASPDMRFGCGASVVIETRRGIEMGEMVSLSCDGCSSAISRDQVQRYVEASGPDYYHFSNGRILRLASPDDLAEWEHIRAETLHKKSFCQRLADQHGLPMKVLECEHLFGGERLIFYFMAEGRVDFRNLVRELADELQTRIEMRQVGARDEARLLADYETCGRECCCKNFLKTLKPVSMKMAKMQKATLDPAKVSGRCGRLKCCLRYEHTTYEDLDRKLPPIGRIVETSHGEGTVVARQILTQLLQIQTADGGLITVPIEDLDPQRRAQRQAMENPEPQLVVEEEPEIPTETEDTNPASPDPEAGEREDNGPAKPRRRSRGRGRGRNRDARQGGNGNEIARDPNGNTRQDETGDARQRGNRRGRSRRRGTGRKDRRHRQDGGNSAGPDNAPPK